MPTCSYARRGLEEPSCLKRRFVFKPAFVLIARCLLLLCVLTGPAARSFAQPAHVPQGPAETTLQPVSRTQVTIQDGFWSKRQQSNRDETIPHLIRMCEREGRVRNMLRAGEVLGGEFEGTRTHDADLFKVIEAAAYTNRECPDPELTAKLDELIEAIATAQRDDGYLHTYRQVRRKEERLPTELNLFAAGHLIDAGVAQCQATGKRTLLRARQKIT